MVRRGACHFERGCGRPLLFGSEARRTNLAALRAVHSDRAPAPGGYTWVSEGTQGVESIVGVTFEPRGDQTEVTLRHSGVPDDEMGRRHQEGWAWVLSKLAER